ncbi:MULTISPECIES: hypothetical protein [Frankia]|uniref:Uncharacterized protein n=1 Tax=Frankia alni (strain DSM 45986 / CECT 9034 / ACN14a) TaxID=326424 RepID=Q0RU97_FRAAA|nr:MULTISPECIES: hypothetical protein [Frankia]CAJ58846.1 hypothetical protein FRAAL0167 [Frankia alni ACN14a]
MTKGAVRPVGIPSAEATPAPPRHPRTCVPDRADGAGTGRHALTPGVPMPDGVPLRDNLRDNAHDLPLLLGSAA